MLDELHQHAARAPRMDEGDAVAVGAGAGLAVDELDAVGLETAELGGEVGHAVGDMMESGAALLEESGHTGISAERLDELEASRSGAEEDDAHALAVDALGLGRGRAAEALEGGQRILNGLNGNGDVVDGQRILHGGLGPLAGARTAKARPGRFLQTSDREDNFPSVHLRN